MLVNSKYQLNEEDINNFSKNGYLILRDFLSESFIEYLEKLSRTSISEPKTNYGSTFNRLKYDVGNNDEKIFALIQDETFQNIIGKLTKRDLIYTQGLSFELKKNKDIGFPWHVGTQSFGCQYKEDYGCTMWIPFCEINPNDQRGGMKYISKEKLSGEFIYQYINLLPNKLIDMKNKGEDIDYNYFYNIKNNIINSPEISKLLDFYGEEDYFTPKDVILFDKYVLHRSVKLLECDISERVAFALRFVDKNSKYDEERAKLLEYPKEEFNYAGSSDFNLDICEYKDQKLIESDFLKDTLSKRQIYGIK